MRDKSVTKFFKWIFEPSNFDLYPETLSAQIESNFESYKKNATNRSCPLSARYSHSTLITYTQ